MCAAAALLARKPAAPPYALFFYSSVPLQPDTQAWKPMRTLGYLNKDLRPMILTVQLSGCRRSYCCCCWLLFSPKISISKFSKLIIGNDQAVSVLFRLHQYCCTLWHWGHDPVICDFNGESPWLGCKDALRSSVLCCTDALGSPYPQEWRVSKITLGCSFHARFSSNPVQKHLKPEYTRGKAKPWRAFTITEQMFHWTDTNYHEILSDLIIWFRISQLGCD